VYFIVLTKQLLDINTEAAQGNKTQRTEMKNKKPRLK
jgi:hypothetical protein